MRPPVRPQSDKRDTDHLLAIFDQYNRDNTFIRALSLNQWPHRRHPHVYIAPGGRRW